MSGVRSSKTVNGVSYEYTTLSGKITRMTWSGNAVDIVYDDAGRPYILRYTPSGGATQTYYYVLNLQGDVVGLMNTSMQMVVKYSYDPWGKLTGTNATSAYVALAQANPLRYRSYCYDIETGFYYLQTRYYDPTIARFINADGYLSTDSTGLLSYNMFAYCENNPVTNSDPTGEFLDTILDVISLAVSVADVISDPSDPWAWAGLAGDTVDLLPFVTGVGEVTKGVGLARKGAKGADNILDAGKAVKKGWKVGDDITNLTSAGKVPSWSAIRSRYWKNQANSGSVDGLYDATRDNVRRMEHGKAPIGFDGLPINLHHRQGISVDIYDFVPMPQSAHQAFHMEFGYTNFPVIPKQMLY